MTKGTFLKVVLGSVFVLLLSAVPAWCTPTCEAFVDPSISLVSSTTGVYNYGITVPSGDPDTCSFFGEGASVSFTGMGGVTGTSVGSSLAASGWLATSFTSSTAVFDIDESGTYAEGGTYGTFTIDCSSCTTGTVGWDIVLNVDPSGSVAGPVSAGVTGAPESGTIGMLLVGLSALGLLAGTKRLRPGPLASRA